ncbi:MAG: hypothetical protein COU90_02625 [Candidatus Ryanbacteria bacterium CG10_big_fil_rev_8_21_14_0_10_43_42]|uniref:Uncharacterized protein n=1 Tax=Candidatus Ryanbacteria bacterium CG10_big_fil_rev_8_21_14_0_10_43_42 TaxID=1974864 RepID=A0A2M8KWP8_9BACT|nr:MAG: hypothetical protein COU90_02625 [Candidatus Ryanbacteria bacterium CG10_big_fil_rev_8_21_14_0_10_43_42]
MIIVSPEFFPKGGDCWEENEGMFLSLDTVARVCRCLWVEEERTKIPDAFNGDLTVLKKEFYTQFTERHYRIILLGGDEYDFVSMVQKMNIISVPDNFRTLLARNDIEYNIVQRVCMHPGDMVIRLTESPEISGWYIAKKDRYG